jgi:hypothetical protein
MSQVLHEKPDTSPRAGAVATGSGRPRRGLATAVVALGLLLGGAAGWSATTMLGPDPDARSNAAATARLEGAADRFAEQQQDELRRREAERQRWEAQADRFDPGWRER